MNDRYPFPVPETVVQRIDQSYVPVWQRYPSYVDEDQYPEAINALRGWQYLFANILPLLKDVLNAWDLSEESAKKSAIYRTLEMMSRDLIDIVDFAQMTLPFDPWIVMLVREAQEMFPELFAAKGNEGPPEGDSDGDRQPATVIPLKRSTPATRPETS